MSEIEKMYENVGLNNLWVERYNDGNGFVHENWYPSYKVMIKFMMEKNGWSLTEAQNVAKKECQKELLPFTAEKQIAILCWLVNLKGNVTFNNKPKDITPKRLQDALAWAINQYWQDLTKEEKQQVKGILECNPIYKRISDGKTVKEFDKGLFGEWVLRK